MITIFISLIIHHCYFFPNCQNNKNKLIHHLYDPFFFAKPRRKELFEGLHKKLSLEQTVNDHTLMPFSLRVTRSVKNKPNLFMIQ